MQNDIHFTSFLNLGKKIYENDIEYQKIIKENEDKKRNLYESIEEKKREILFLQKRNKQIQDNVTSLLKSFTKKKQNLSFSDTHILIEKNKVYEKINLEKETIDKNNIAIQILKEEIENIEKDIEYYN
jgi:hypothetical protein